ncbi:BTAD domain-containing putative transcriptional regulator [Amycolatopsis palatopharyngis]|uniref:BTAD domain-containing putative transcriptional regulator n=1 Tax=Amycolatopsis palatopharyngis TaxID=187982 RepID=UPI000E22368A|nr:BTAD domain-containing putative transcriptional regulator [Amycolatopsis palatopharyngis]
MREPSGLTRIARAARLLGRAVRGLLAVVLLAALVAGLPFALIYGVGWPLPDHLPSLDEIGSALLAPISSTFLLDTLACLTWLLWLVFVTDVAGCAIEVARGARWPQLRTQTGPVRRVAAVLVGALLIAVLGRTATAVPIAPAEAARPVGYAPVAATAPDWTEPVNSDHNQTGIPLSRSQSPVERGIERVRAPENGVHDSLWRIAQRRLGDGERWPEIWVLNEGRSQPSGHVLTDPNLIYPGDTLLLPKTSECRTPPALPLSEHAPPAPESVSPSPSTATPPSSAPAPSTTPVAKGAVEQDADDSAGGAVTWGSGEVFVSLGLAAAVSALLMLARRRHSARYRPGTGRRDDDLPVAPVVYQLRLAHLRAQHYDEDTDLDAASELDTDTPAASQRHRARAQSDTSRSGTGAPGQAKFGIEGQVRVFAPRICRVIGATNNGTGPEDPPSLVDIALDTNTAEGEGSQVALDLARVHGLGVVGPGGYAAARALLLTLLTSRGEDESVPTVLVPATDLARVLGVAVVAADLPDTVTVAADLDTALAALDAAASHRPTVLIAAPPREPGRQARLRHLLDNHSPVSALLLGQWRAGVTVYVTAAGIISATDPGLGEPLRGTRAFTLPETATRELLAFLRATQPAEGASGEPEPAPRQSATSPQVEPPQPDHARAGPDRLEITSGPPAPQVSPVEAGEPAGEPRTLSPSTAETTEETPAPLVLTVFGAPALYWRHGPAQPAAEPRDLSGELSSRPVELLVYLAVHPAGVPREGIVDALWPDAPPRNPASVLRTVLSRIRRALDTATGGELGELVLVEHGQYRLDPAVVEVDYWGFAGAVTARRAATTPQRRTDACEAIVAHYGGLLAEGVDGEWLVAARESTRRDALDAVAALARARVEADPDYTLDLLETARAFDPHNELLYRDIMRLQHALGWHEAISRTLTLLRTRLAELDATPTTDTVDLAARLRARHTGIPVDDDVSRSTAP